MWLVSPAFCQILCCVSIKGYGGRANVCILGARSISSDQVHTTTAKGWRRWYEEETSITLSADVLVQIDRLVGSQHSGFPFIEYIFRRFLRERAWAAIEAYDLERINSAADRLNREAVTSFHH